MATGDYTYGTVARVQILVGDVVTSRTFASGTIPSLSQVELMLDDIAAEINMELEGARYTLETASNLATNQARVSDFLISLNSIGASVSVLGMMPSTSYNPGEEGEGTGRKDTLLAQYKRGLKRIQDGLLPASRSTVRMKVGSAEDAAGNVNKPIFTRDMTDWPGTRSLTEA